MASQHQVRQYLAYWFQLGRRVFLHNGSEALLPKPVISGGRYSVEFEECWQKIISPDSGDCYLESTGETIAELLRPAWEIESCARCLMPIPLRRAGMPPENCPCFDLSNWPDPEKPQPRAPVNTQAQLLDICSRLIDKVSGE